MKLHNLFAFMLIALITACSNFDESVRSARDQVPLDSLPDNAGVIHGGAKDINEQAARLQNPVRLRRATSPWIGGTLIPLAKDKTLPAIFEQDYHMDFGQGQVSLQTVAARLTKLTGVPVRISRDVFAEAVKDNASQDSGNAVSSAASLSVNSVNMRWNGQLRDFLNHITSVLNLSWQWKDGAVVIMRLITQAHNIQILPSEQQYSFSAGGAGSSSGQASSLNTQDTFSESGVINSFDSIVQSISLMVESVSGSSFVANPATGLVMVTTIKEVQDKIRDYLAQENARLSQQVNITMDIYTIRDTDTENQQINLNAALQTLEQRLGISASIPSALGTGAAASFTLSRLGGEADGTTVILQALRSAGMNVSHRPVSLTTSNGRLKTQYNSNSQAYVSQTTPGTASSSGAAGAPGLTTSTINTGDAFSVLPVVQPDGSVLLRYSIILSTLTGLDNFSSGSGDTLQTVQIPATETITDGATVHLQAGQALMITGLSRLSSTFDTTRLGRDIPIVLGGSNRGALVREHFIVILRATPL